ncbi:hypothetical protein [Thermosphaera sp.]
MLLKLPKTLQGINYEEDVINELLNIVHSAISVPTPPAKHA